VIIIEDTEVNTFDFLRKYFNDAVIIVVIIIGLIGGVVSANSSLSSISVAIFFALAITSFTYRFLGGINETTGFTLGAVKTSGTLAALFGSIWLIVELYEVPSDFSFPVDLRPNQIYLFDASGEPAERVVTPPGDGEVQELTFGKVPRSKFRDKPRDYRIEHNKVYVTTLADSIYLGFIDEERETLSDNLLSPEHSLYLGLYLGDKDEAGSRRDPFAAVQYLFRVLAQDSDLKLKETAINKLYFLQDRFKEPEQFDLFLKMTGELKTGYNMHLELASTYLNYSYKLAADKKTQQRAALLHYLEFLSTPQSLDPKLESTKSDVIEKIRELMHVHLREDAFVLENRTKLTEAIDRHERTRLKEFAEKLAIK
jgi:hypothetical protein